MLELINTEREEVGLSPLQLGSNIAAQLHAEASLANCFSSNWGVDGLKPYMRYTLAGGYQSNSMSTYGQSYCVKRGEGHTRLRPINTELEYIAVSTRGDSGAPMFSPSYEKVNIGLAWDEYNLFTVHHFEGDSIEYGTLPDIQDGYLSFSATLRNGIQFTEDGDLDVQIYYDPPPENLSQGQLARTACFGRGRLVANLRPLPREGYEWTDREYSDVDRPCLSPHDIAPDVPAPSSLAEARHLKQEAKEAARNRESETILVPWITALEWAVSGERAVVKADINEVLIEHGHGVYTIVVWGEKGDDYPAVSTHSIFHGITPPNTYTPKPMEAE